MSKIYKNGKKNSYDVAIETFTGILADDGHNLNEIGERVPAFEALVDSDAVAVQNTFTEIAGKLEQDNLLAKVFPGASEEQITMATEAATIALAISSNEESASAWMSEMSASRGNGIVVDPSKMAGGHYNDVIAQEGFDPASANKYAQVSAMVAARTTIQESWMEALFPTYVTTGNGIDIKTNVPRIWSGYKHSLGGAAGEYKKHSLIDCLIDSELIDDESAVKVVPYVDTATAAYLVASADVATKNVMVGNVTVETRPLKFGQVNLKGVSQSPTLLGGNVYTHEDTLDPVMGLGTVYIKVTEGSNNSVLSQDTEGQFGALLAQTIDGSDHDYIAVSNTHIYASEVDLAASADQINSALGGAAGDKFSLEFVLNVSARVNTETAEAEFTAGSLALTGVIDKDGVEITGAAFDAVVALLTLEAVGIDPDIRRTNSNMRQLGILSDLDVNNGYRLAIKSGGPIAATAPVNKQTRATVESLAGIVAVRNRANAVRAIKGMIATLQSQGGFASNSPAIGRAFVKPTFVEHLIDFDTDLVGNNSKDNLVNVEGLLTSVVVSTANQMVSESGYDAAAEYVTGAADGYEVVVITSSDMGNYLQRAGIDRGKTFGGVADSVTAASSEKFFKDKLLVALRRKDRGDQPHPLDSGAHVVAPSVVYDANVSSGGSTRKLVQMIPMSSHYALLPVLGVINLVNQDKLFTTN